MMDSPSPPQSYHPQGMGQTKNFLQYCRKCMIYRENFQFRQNAFMKKDFSPSWGNQDMPQSHCPHRTWGKKKKFFSQILQEIYHLQGKFSISSKSVHEQRCQPLLDLPGHAIVLPLPQDRKQKKIQYCRKCMIYRQNFQFRQNPFIN